MKRSTLLLALLAAGMLAGQAQTMGNKSYGNDNYNLESINVNRSNADYENTGNAQVNASMGGYTYGQPNYNSRAPVSSAAIQLNTEVPLEVNGLMNIVASDYVAMFNVIQVGETPDNTNQLMNKRISTFKAQLSLSGIDTSGIYADMISFVPKYDYQVENKLFSKTYNEVPAGFEMQKTVSVHFKISGKIDAIVSAAATAEIYDLVKVDYFIPNLQQKLDSLRMQCLDVLKSKVNSYTAIGFKLDTMKRVMGEHFTTVYPDTRYFSYTAVSKPSLNAVRKKSGADKVNEVATSASQYYGHVSYDQYDFVINPVITEPVVQLSYSIEVKYFMNEKPDPKNVYYFITPSGDVKQLEPK